MTRAEADGIRDLDAVCRRERLEAPKLLSAGRDEDGLWIMEVHAEGRSLGTARSAKRGSVARLLTSLDATPRLTTPLEGLPANWPSGMRCAPWVRMFRHPTREGSATKMVGRGKLTRWRIHHRRSSAQASSVEWHRQVPPQPPPKQRCAPKLAFSAGWGNDSPTLSLPHRPRPMRTVRAASVGAGAGAALASANAVDENMHVITVDRRRG